MEINSKISISWRTMEENFQQRSKSPKTEIISRATRTMAAVAKPKTVWKEKNICLKSKIRLQRGIPTTPIYLYTCEFWTLKVENQRGFRAYEMKCYRTTIYLDHVTNDTVWEILRQEKRPAGNLHIYRREEKVEFVWTRRKSHLRKFRLRQT